MHYDVDATITPETKFRASLLQVCVGVAIVASFVTGYAFLMIGVQATSKDVVEIKAAQAETIKKTSDALVEQDKKRDDLGRKFIESNEKIASSIGQLTTLTAVQQERQKSTDEKLERVLTELGQRLSGQPTRKLP